MLISASRLIDCPILSLHVAGEIARVTELIIDPNELRVIAVRAEGPVIDNNEVGDILPIDAVREFSSMGMIIDSADKFALEDDVIRIQEILKLRFALPGMKVITKKKEKIGKVTDYILNTGNWEVRQLVVQRPIMKAFIDPELLITRDKIIEITDYEIIIKSEKDRSKSKIKATTIPEDFVPNFINPFRKPDFSESADVE